MCSICLFDCLNSNCINYRTECYILNTLQVAFLSGLLQVNVLLDDL